MRCEDHDGPPFALSARVDDAIEALGLADPVLVSKILRHNLSWNVLNVNFIIEADGLRDGMHEVT